MNSSNFDVHGYYKYNEDVLSGKIVAPKTIILACKRFNTFLHRDDMYFDEADVDMRIKFVSLLKHSTGRFADKPFYLLDWQKWVFANIFGFKWKSDNSRVTKNVFIFCARKNGKTALAAALSLCTLICDKQKGAEVDFVSNNSKQAAICLNATQSYARSIDPHGKFFKQYRSELRIPKMESIVQVLSGDSMGNDGFNPSCFVWDEAHAAKSYDTYEVMKSGQGMRDNPLAIVITTSGFLPFEGAPCYDMWLSGIKVLEGRVKDDSTFNAIYQLDEGDDWHDEHNWIKSTPSLGDTVKYDYLRERVATADANASQKPQILTKNFNIWSQDLTAWISSTLLKKYSQPFELDDLVNKYPDEAQYCYMGIDLSSVSDLTAISVMLKIQDKYYFKSWAFLPEDNVANNANSELYHTWNKKGYLLFTPGNVCDYDYILGKVLAINDKIPIMKIAYDAWNSTSFAISATEKGLPMQPYSQALGNFNRPTKEFERLLLSGKVVLDDSALTRWCFSNVELMYDHNENVKPTKGKSKTCKIDLVISMLEALGTFLYDNNEDTPSAEVL